MTAILTPPKPEIVLPWFYPSAETEAERQRILAARFFLVKIAGNGAVPRCKRCGSKHDHLTLMCVPQPFSGLTRGLFAYYKTIGMYGNEKDLPPAERSRLRDMDRLFGPAAGLPDLASLHPETAHALKVGSRDADIGAYSFVATEPSSTALGLVEPVDRATATRYRDRINLRGCRPKFALPGLEED